MPKNRRVISLATYAFDESGQFWRYNRDVLATVERVRLITRVLEMGTYELGARLQLLLDNPDR